MSRFLKLMSVLAIVALIAVPAFAEVQNVKVSGDIDSKMINRSNYDFNNGNTSDTDTWFMSTARLQVDADLTDNDLMYEEGQRDEMLGKLQVKLGKTKEELNKFLDSL